MAKKNTKRGFTLVELIVVLVILAILAALLIPALTGYIDKARKNQVVAETRALTQAVQTEMSTIYALNDEFQRQKSIGKNLTIASKDGDYGMGNGQLDDKLKERYAEIIRLSEVPILEKELESTTGKSSFFAIINKKVLFSGQCTTTEKGISEYIAAMKVKPLRLKKTKHHCMRVPISFILEKSFTLYMKTTPFGRKMRFIPVWES